MKLFIEFLKIQAGCKPVLSFGSFGLVLFPGLTSARSHISPLHRGPQPSRRLSSSADLDQLPGLQV